MSNTVRRPSGSERVVITPGGLFSTSHVACALLAARLLRDRLTDVRGLSASIGVSAGPVVAGNIGTKERFEYTVIGDPVNEAARLTELAKTRPERLLVSASMLDLVPDSERRHWTPNGQVVLRGRITPTNLALPA